MGFMKVFGRRIGTVNPQRKKEGPARSPQSWWGIQSYSLLWPRLILWMGDVCTDVCAAPPGLTCFVYPGAVPIQLTLNLLLPPQFHESSSVLHSLSLFGKFPVDEKNKIYKQWIWVVPWLKGRVKQAGARERLSRWLSIPHLPFPLFRAATITSLKCCTETYLVWPHIESFPRSVSSQSALTPSACSILKGIFLVRWQTRVRNAMFCFPSYNIRPLTPLRGNVYSLCF